MTRSIAKKIILSALLFTMSCYSSFAQKNTFPYKLNYFDIALLGIGSSSLITGKYIESNQANMSNAELIALNAGDINSFDRSATNNWNKNADLTSEVVKFTLVASPSVLLANQVLNKQWKNSLSYATMYFETALLTYGLTELTKAATKRIRPYMYNSDVTTAQKEEFISTQEVYDSYFSGTTSIAFASAVFLSKTYSDIYGKSTWSKIIWGSSLTLASTTGYLRYKSGNHFPTDIISGAIVGSAIGYIIPVLHKTANKNENLSFLLSGNHFCATYTF